MVLPFGALMTMPSTAAAAAGAARSLITSGGEIADVHVLVAPRLLVETTRHQVAKPSFAELFQNLRERLRLPVQKYAVLLGLRSGDAAVPRHRRPARGHRLQQPASPPRLHDMPRVMLPELWVYRRVVRQLMCLPARPWEVGGWLLGYWTADERALLVTHATPPAGRGTPFGVKVSGRGHSERFDEAWEHSGGHVTFLGDWHTHPGCAALPSRRDGRAIMQLAGDPAYGTPRPLSAIIQAPRWPFSKVRDVVRWHLTRSERPAETDELNARVVDDVPDEATRVPHWEWPARR